jgi:predicted nucleotidyltransferase
MDFNVAEGDTLDLSDLLNTAENASNLDLYLSFEKSENNTIIHINNKENVVSTIELKGVDLITNNNLSDQAIIERLIDGNNLVTEL